MNMKEQVQEALIGAMQHTSQAELARRMGVSPATLVNVKTGQWELISSQMLTKLRIHFALDGWQVRNTHNFVAITKLCEDARQNARMLAVAAYTGAGKTTALRHYSNANADTFYVLATVLHSKKSFLEAIAAGMGINAPYSINGLADAIVQKLNASDRPLLIIDDAGKLSHSCLRLVQIIYDRTENHAGIVLAGTEFLKDEIDRGCRRNAQGFRELRRRIAYWQPLRRPNAAIVKAIAADYGIVEPAALDYVSRTCRDYGTLRNLILNADRVRQHTNEPITASLLSDLHVGDTEYEAQKQ